MRSGEIPQFGVLQGVKILSTGTAYAGPFAATLMGEIGADVIHVENTGSGDMARSGPLGWAMDHRNQRVMSLDIPSERGREVFRRLIEWADIWIESSKGGTYSRWGLTDEVVWSYNPKVVIVHVSGYGQHGSDSHVSRPGYDGIAQAYSGFMHWNGEPDPAPPLRVKPFIADFLPPFHAAFVAVAALRRAEQTGQGESIDFAQYESMVRVQNAYLLEALNGGLVPKRTGNSEEHWGVYDTFSCADGRSIMILISGPAMWKRALPMLGLDGDPDFPEPFMVARRPSVAFDKANGAVSAFCAALTAAEAENQLNAIGVACSRVFSPEDMKADPHYQARETLVTWNDELSGKQVTGPNIVPPFATNPNRIWRSGPAYNADTDDILDELGFGEEERNDLYTVGACRAPVPPKDATTTRSASIKVAT